jgi:hypothetical protein
MRARVCVCVCVCVCCDPHILLNNGDVSGPLLSLKYHSVSASGFLDTWTNAGLLLDTAGEMPVSYYN